MTSIITMSAVFVNLVLNWKYTIYYTITMNVDSIVKSWMSIYEIHNEKQRTIIDRAERKDFLAVNGQLLQHAEHIQRY